MHYGLITSNDDNAQLAFENSSANGNPFWKTFFTGTPRQDFFPNKTFVDLLKGNTGTFKKVDPRVFVFAAPKGLSWADYRDKTPAVWADKDKGLGIDLKDPKNYVGLPYGITNALKADVADFTQFNFFSKDVLNAERPEVLMEAAEVNFLLSENKGWSQAEYIKGIEESMKKWGVLASDITAYTSGLAAANQENVLTQKYIALFLQADEAWNEYRRTGYPNTSILLLPGEEGTMLDGTTKYIFTPMRNGNVTAKDIPARLRYPAIQQTLNGESRLAAANKLSNKDEIDSKLFFAK